MDTTNGSPATFRRSWPQWQAASRVAIVTTRTERRIRRMTTRAGTVAQRGGRLRGEDVGVEELLDGRGGEGRLVDEQRPVAGARLGEVRVAGRVDDDEPAPAPRAARVLEHRQHQQVVEPDVDELGPVDGVERPGHEQARPVGDLAVARQPARLRWLPPVDVVVRRDDADDPLRSIAEVENERDVERDEVAEPGRIETPRRMREADGAARCRARPATTCGRPGRRAGGQRRGRRRG